jgi:hypothetical protein
MGLMKLLALPVLGGPLLVQRLARLVADEAERERLDEGGVRGDLLGLQERLEAGEVSEGEYDREERRLLERLREIRAARSGG